MTDEEAFKAFVEEELEKFYEAFLRSYFGLGNIPEDEYQADKKYFEDMFDRLYEEIMMNKEEKETITDQAEVDLSFAIAIIKKELAELQEDFDRGEKGWGRVAMNAVVAKINVLKKVLKQLGE